MDQAGVGVGSAVSTLTSAHAATYHGSHTMSIGLITAARLRDATPLAPTRTFTGQPGHLRRPWGPGWALVGDAGSWKDPISAHGLTDPLRDAELLARTVISVHNGEQPEREAYLAYEALTKDRLSEPILTIADEIAAFRWDDQRIRDLLLELNAAMNVELDVITGFDRRPPTATATWRCRVVA